MTLKERVQLAMRGRQTAEIHTDTVDSCWKFAKQSIPASLCSSKDQSEINKAIWTYVGDCRSIVKHGDFLMSLTGKTLAQTWPNMDAKELAACSRQNHGLQWDFLKQPSKKQRPFLGTKSSIFDGQRIEKHKNQRNQDTHWEKQSTKSTGKHHTTENPWTSKWQRCRDDCSKGWNWRKRIGMIILHHNTIL